MRDPHNLSDPNPEMDLLGIVKTVACLVLLGFGIALTSVGIYWFASAMKDSGLVQADAGGDMMQFFEEAKNVLLGTAGNNDAFVIATSYWFGVLLKFAFSLVMVSIGLKSLVSLVGLCAKKKDKKEPLTELAR